MSTILVLIALLAAAPSVSSEACTQKLDLFFVIDGSSSICGNVSCPDWIYCLQFVKNIVSSFNIGPDATRVALVTVSSEGKLEWFFDQYRDKDSLLSAIDKVGYPGGEVDSILSIKNIGTSLITAARLDAIVVGILISDGAPRASVWQTVAASIALQAIGMKGFVVCVTDRCPVDIARSVSSPPKQIDVNYFVAKDYSSIDNAREKLVKQICSIKKTSILDSLVEGVSSVLGFK